MAIAESIRIGISHRVEKHPTPITPDLKIEQITQFSRAEALDLARAYTNNRLSLKKPFNMVEKFRLEGILEVQKKVLTMIGQHHLIGINPLKDIQNEEDLTRDMRSIDMSDVKRLISTYLESKSYVIDHKLEKREWTEILPEEMNMYAKLFESGKILTMLGQKNLILKINKKFDSPSEHVDWAKMRSSGHGEIL